MDIKKQSLRFLAAAEALLAVTKRRNLLTHEIDALMAEMINAHCGIMLLIEKKEGAK